jgi:hypothetical protein
MMQVIDFKYLYVAQLFSNPSGSAPILDFGRGEGRLSTKLSTALVDDRFGFSRSCELLPACHKFVAGASPFPTP